jgi:hypothetical protein
MEARRSVCRDWKVSPIMIRRTTLASVLAVVLVATAIGVVTDRSVAGALVAGGGSGGTITVGASSGGTTGGTPGTGGTATGTARTAGGGGPKTGAPVWAHSR